MTWQCVQNRKMHWCFCNTIGNSLYHLNAGYQIPALSNLAPYFFQTSLMITPRIMVSRGTAWRGTLLVVHYAFQLLLQRLVRWSGPPTTGWARIQRTHPSTLWNSGSATNETGSSSNLSCIVFPASYVVFAPPLPLPLLWGCQFFWQRHQTASEQSVSPLQQPCKMQGLPPALVPASQVWTWVPGTQRLCCWTSGCKQDLELCTKRWLFERSTRLAP